jgi:hypothetical protein
MRDAVVETKNPGKVIHRAIPTKRAMAMIDKRVGRNRLQKHKPKSGVHSLIQLFYDLRLRSDEGEA